MQKQRRNGADGSRRSVCLVCKEDFGIEKEYGERDAAAAEQKRLGRRNGIMKTEFKISSPEKEGIDSGYLLNFLNEVEKTGSEIHGIMFLVNGNIIFEAYNAPYASNIPHIMHSFTKCLTNMAVGLAYSKGLVELDAPILKYLPEYAVGANAYLKAVTVENLITMRSGQQRSIGGNEWRPLKDSWLDAYFKVPFVKQPGSEFMYSSGNSYVLSAIVQRVTGKTCREYLREHITEAIGMSDFTWMLSPEGICSGGNGVSLTVEDMARIGLLYLQHGNWNGRQLLEEDWVRRSLGEFSAVENKTEEINYNYHWSHTGDIWASMGMFGQACILVPEMEMVVAMTAADDKNVLCDLLQQQIVTPWKQQRNLEAVDQNPILGDVQIKDVLYRKGLRMTLESKYRSVSCHKQPSPGRYVFLPIETIDGVTEIAVVFDENSVIYEMEDDRGRHSVKAGLEYWNHGVTSMTGGYLHHQYEMDRLRISACAYWQEESTLMLEWRYPEMAFCDFLRIVWDEDRITVKRWVNMNSQDTERPLIEAVRRTDHENES